ncbi:hypothetical protein [Pseudolysinimonas sp.]|uniref:hypothetical protein n=1 Tax=Pseudolysinimonas sp. TaxID=2680009 RepID=UPI003F81740B
MPLAAAAASTNFVGAIVTALEDAGMLSDQIVVIDPNTLEVDKDYDPEADTGGQSRPVKLIGPRAAYVKALEVETVQIAGKTRHRMGYRIQFVPEAGDPLITEGMVIRVLEGGGNPALARYVFTVSGVPSGSINALTKVECKTDGQPAPIWTEP